MFPPTLLLRTIQKVKEKIEVVQRVTYPRTITDDDRPLVDRKLISE